MNKKWAAGASVNVANDEELLELLEKAGCIALFIGMESINASSLRYSHKHHNQVGQYRDMIQRLHDHGIGVTGAFVFGFDQDDISVFDRTLEFTIKIDLDCMTPAILTPLPATALYSRMEHERRILDRNWAHYDYFHVVFEPKQINREDLYEGFLRFTRDFFSYKSIFARLRRSRTQPLLAILANLDYHHFYQRMLHEYESGLRNVNDVSLNET